MSAPSVISLDQIEETARAIQIEMWDRQVSLWEGRKVTPLDVCDPEMAALLRGYEYREGLIDDAGSQAGRYELAGFVDRRRRLIAISDRLSPQIKRFTAAHELGHLELHVGLHHHRERPISGIAEPFEPVDPIEREANQFAGCFLVPRKQLRLALRACFGRDQLRLTDVSAYELAGPSGFRALMLANARDLSVERTIAQTHRFVGRQFEPLYKTFGVSVTTMAIRIRQVGFVLA